MMEACLFIHSPPYHNVISFSSTFQHPENVLRNPLPLFTEAFGLDLIVNIQSISINILKEKLGNVDIHKLLSYS